MSPDKKVRSVRIHGDEIIFYLDLAPLLAQPFLHFVESQTGREAFSLDPGENDRAAPGALIVGGVPQWKALIALRHDPLLLTLIHRPIDFVLDTYWRIACGFPPDGGGTAADLNAEPRFGLSEFLHDPQYSRWIDNYQVSQLLVLGDTGPTGNASPSSAAETVSLAIECLERMAFFGLREFERHSGDLFCYTFELPASNAGGKLPMEANILSPRWRGEILPADLEAEIERRNRLDRQLYRRAQTLFFARYRMLARRLEAELQWKQAAFAGIQIVTLDASDKFSRVELAVAKFTRRIREFILPPGSKLDGWARETYRRFRQSRTGLDYPPENDMRPSMPSYHNWLQAGEEAAACSENVDGERLFSLLLLAHVGETERLSATIRSCLASNWPGFELLVFYPDGDEDLRAELERLQAGDERVRLCPLGSHPPAAPDKLAAVVDQVRGDYLIFLDCGDEIHTDYLRCIQEAIAAGRANRPVDIVYTDEDQLNEEGERCDPWFKPGSYSPEMLLSVNYLQCAAYRRSLFGQPWLQEIAFPSTTAQAWAVAFHCVETAGGEVVHVPRVLNHSRRRLDRRWAEEESSNCAKAIEGHLTRSGRRDVVVQMPQEGVFRANWAVEQRDKVSIIIPSKNQLRLIRRCLETILERTDYPDYEIVLVDTGSSERGVRSFYDEIEADQRIRIVQYGGDFNYSRANNLGADHASGELLLFLNNDTEVLERGWLNELVRWAQLPEIGAVGAKLLYPDGSIQAFGSVLGMLGHAHHVFSGMPEDHDSIFGSTMWYRDVMAITGACMLMRREVFDWVGGFNTEYRIAFSDVEICLKIFQAGYRILCTPFARLMHHEGKSRSKSVPLEDIVRGLDNFGGFIQAGDRYYNVNLSLDSTVPTLRSAAEEDALKRIAQVVYRMRDSNTRASGSAR